MLETHLFNKGNTSAAARSSYVSTSKAKMKISVLISNQHCCLEKVLSQSAYSFSAPMRTVHLATKVQLLHNCRPRWFQKFGCHHFCFHWFSQQFGWIHSLVEYLPYVLKIFFGRCFVSLWGPCPGELTTNSTSGIITLSIAIKHASWTLFLTVAVTLSTSFLVLQS